RYEAASFPHVGSNILHESDRVNRSCRVGRLIRRWTSYPGNPHRRFQSAQDRHDFRRHVLHGVAVRIPGVTTHEDNTMRINVPRVRCKKVAVDPVGHDADTRARRYALQPGSIRAAYGDIEINLIAPSRLFTCHQTTLKRQVSTANARFRSCAAPKQVAFDVVMGADDRKAPQFWQVPR